MLTLVDRATVLEQFGLPDRDAFEIEPCRDDHGVWRIKVSHQGDPAILMSQGHASRLAEAVHPIDPDLSDQFSACLEKAKRYEQNPD